jgi:ribosomal protein S11
MLKQVKSEGKSKKIIADLYITTSFCNMFITVKLDKKVICSISGGACRENAKENKRFKLSPGTISNVVKKLNSKFEENSIKEINVICKVSLKYIIKVFLSSLCSYNIKINKIQMLIPIAHNGVRGRKLKRK